MNDATPPLRGHSLVVGLLAWAAFLGFETLAQVGLKAAGERLEAVDFGVEWIAITLSEPWALAGAAGYLGAFVAWMAILDRMPLSLGFPLTSLVYLTVTVASVVLFHETLGPLRLVGITLIVVGVAIIGSEER